MNGMMDGNLAFSSLQCHINKVYEGDGLAPYVGVVRQGRIDRNLSDSRTSFQCAECQRRDQRTSATQFCVLLGVEFMLCDEHAIEFRRDCEHKDNLVWFCKPIIRKREITDTTRYVLVWKVPEDLKAKYGLIPWFLLNQPYRQAVDRDQVESGNGFVFLGKINPTMTLPDNVRWEPISLDECVRLESQITEERNAGRPVFLIGFGPDHPFDRPDFSLAYTVESALCRDCPDRHVEPYYFSHSRLPTPQDYSSWSLRGVDGRMKTVIFDPERFNIFK